MRASTLTRHHEAVTQKKHEAAHFRDVRLSASSSPIPARSLMMAQVVGNLAEPLEQLMVHDVSIPEEHLPDRRHRCLWFVH